METANETDNGEVLSHVEAFARHSKKVSHGSKYKSNVTPCIVVTCVEGITRFSSQQDTISINILRIRQLILIWTWIDGISYETSECSII